MRRPVRALLGPLSAVLLFLSCVDGDPTIAPRGPAVRVPLATQVIPGPANATALTINRIRAVARTASDNRVIAETTLTVDPNATVWDVPLEIPTDGLTTDVLVELALINVSASGTETIEFSGQVGPLSVQPGRDASPVTVPVVRGPLDNLAVTGVDVTNSAPALIEGGTRALQATVTTNRAGAAPQVFWTSLTPNLLSVDGALATALLPGAARVIATAGTVSDTADIQILARPAAVGLSPEAQSVALGADVTFSGSVLDARGQPIAGQAVLWRSLDPTILEPTAEGRFRTLASGIGRIEARAAADTALKRTGTVTVTRTPVDLAVTKTTRSTQASVGDTVVFSLGVANTSTSTEAADVKVRDALPAGLTFASAAGTGSYDAATSTWTVGRLAAGARAAIDLRARLGSGTPGTTVTNTAEVVANAVQTDPNPANNSSNASFLVVEPGSDLALTKTALRASVLETDTVSFRVTVKNAGNRTASSIVVGDSLPATLVHVAASATQGTFDAASSTWAAGTLLPGDSAWLNLTVRTAVGTGATTQTNVARVLSFVGARDANAANDRGSASVSVLFSGSAADVSVTKTVAIASRQVGDTAVFTVKVKNFGANPANGVTVSDSLAAGLGYLSATATVGSYVPASRVWTIGNMAVGDSAILTMRAGVSGSVGQVLTNTARYLAAATPDLVPGNNTATASVTVTAPAADIEVVKVVDLPTPFELAHVRFTVTTTNLGPNPSTNIRVKDVLPAGLTLDSTRTTTGTIQGDTLWTIPALAVSTSAMMYVYARVNDLTGGTTLINQARRIGHDQTDTNASNDVGSASVNVQRRKLDLVVRKTADNPRPAINTAFKYIVTVVNRGPGAATNVVVTDTVPASLTLDSVQATAGAYAAPTWTIPTLAQGDSAMLRVSVHVPAALSGQTATNRARRTSQTQTDTIAANDSASATVTVPVNNPPVVAISTPNDNAVYNPGDTITFTATASDVEDGPLTTSIVWTSNVSGAMGTGGTVTRSNLAPGPHLVTARVTDTNGNIVADTVPLTIAIVTAPVSLNVPYGGNASMPISLSAPAPAGGLTLNITSADSTKVRVVTPTVTIPAGALSANAQLSGVLPGSAVVTAATIGYGSASTSVSVTAALNIVQSSISFPQGYNGSFTVRLESQGVQIAAPAGGLSVTLAAAAPTCVAVPATVTIPAGQVSVTTTAAYGGTAGVPCNSNVTATAPSVTQDAFTVYVNTPPALTVYTNRVGSGLITSGSVQMDFAQHGGVTVRVTSLDPTVALVSANSTTAGTAFIDVFVPNNSSSFTYYLQGVETKTGDIEIQATAPGFATDTTAVPVEQPAVMISNLGTNYTSLNADIPFYVLVGVSDIYYGGVNSQNIRPGGTPLTATLTSSDTSKARLVTTAQSGDVVTVQVPVGTYYSPTTVAAGGVALDVRNAGTTTVQASIPGLVARPTATVAVTVTAPGITAAPYTAQVGGDLQTASYAYLGSGNHGGVTVRLVSKDSASILLAPNASTPGTGTIDVVVPNGQTQISYYLQGVGSAVSQVPSKVSNVTVSAPGFAADSVDHTVVRPYLALSLGSNPNYTSLDADVSLYAAVGVSDVYYGGVSGQAVRPGIGALTVTIASSDSSKARLVTTARSGDTVTVSIPAGQYYSPTSGAAAGGAALDLRSAGTTTLSATAPGFLQRPNATPVVTITSPVVYVYAATVGSGLQTNASAYLGAPAPTGGVTVTLVSSNPSAILLAPTAGTPGTSSITVNVPQNQTSIGYYVQGIEATTGTAYMRVSAPGFVADSAIATNTQPYVALAGLPTSTNTLATNNAIYAQVGLSDVYYGGVSTQAVRAGGTALTATIQSNQVGVGQIQTSAGTSGSATVTIPVGSSNSPTTVLAGGAAFDPVGAGTTTVTTSIPGFLQRPTASQAVTVSVPGITVSTVNVAGGMMVQASLSLGASQHGGVNVTIRSSSPSIAAVSANSSTAGADSVVVFLANGTSSLSFWVHGMDGQTGTITLTASAPGFTDGTAPVNVVQPALILSSLATSISVSAADDVFQVSVGMPSGSSVSTQARRAGATPLVATITSSQPSVGTLVTSAGSGSPRTVSIAAGASSSPTTIGLGGVAFDPLTQGSTAVSATIPGFIAQPGATVNVTVGP